MRVGWGCNREGGREKRGPDGGGEGGGRDVQQREGGECGREEGRGS